MQETTQYTNTGVVMASVDPVEPMAFEPLDPAYKKMNTMLWYVIWGGVIALLLIINQLSGVLDDLRREGTLPVLLVILAGAAIAGAIFPAAIWRSMGFFLRDHDLHFRHGLIWKHTVSLPYKRIQHVELESNPLERIFKLGTLKFFTAGGGSADMTIPGLRFPEASKLRTYVLARASEAATTPEAQDSK